MTSLRSTTLTRNSIRSTIFAQTRTARVLPRARSVLPVQTRQASTEPTKQVGNVETPGFKPRPSVSGPGAVRVGTLFTSLIALAVAVTGYGLYEYYTSFSAWPVSIRDDLRAALKARNRGDVRRAESYFRKALATARGIKAELNEPTPTPKGNAPGDKGEAMLKISGIAIALAALLEGEGRVAEAYQVLEDVWEELMEQGKYRAVSADKGEWKRGDKDRMRGVQIAQKLGLLGQLPEVRIVLLEKLKEERMVGGEGENKKGMFALTGTAESRDPAERWLVWSVEELFRLVLPSDVRASALAAARAPESSNMSSQDAPAPAPAAPPTLKSLKPPTSISLADLDLPPWVSKLDLLASIESLGTFYASKNLAEYAVPLYLQTLSILLPPNPSSGGPTASERCKAGLVMNNLSQLLSGSNVKDATKWALKGLEVTDKTVAMAGFEEPTPPPPQTTTPQDTNKSKGESGAIQVVQSSEERTNEVRFECLGVKLTLLYNLGVLSDMAGDKCQARLHFQKAYALADKIATPTFQVAKQKAAESLARLERRSAK
ncbi:uncharacterized protein MEPE_01295 [Melanopsichium pennsylvanicum]|uniref:Uncharacterized protein n=2 Tax=Melanopsichium pennsylvanicum TaxID=63383 RepID=A0AAJ5C3L7_9BASI|nr:conserved hypothetical protein [Melanopsichium pennsylvanicum 4]SNX82589.1 uncharacterized protein MEPE_01295 [Melanopsichium pennsylvanicum]